MQQEFFVTCPKGLYEILQEELTKMGIPQAKQTRGGVKFKGSLKDAYNICLWSRVANRVLMPIAEFHAHDEEELYQGVQEIDWTKHLHPSGTIAVDSNLIRSRLTHSHYVALKVKDAIVDQIREKTGDRPDVDPSKPDVRLNLFLQSNMATLSIDLSGNSLHQRGYRLEGMAAPIKENLAAGLLYKAGWPAIAEAGGSFMDPMCGSGTIPIEALMMAIDMAPGANRDYYGFQGWKGHEPKIWEDLFNEAEARFEKGLDKTFLLIGYDEDKKAIALCHEALENLDLVGCIHFEAKPMQAITSTIRQQKNPGLILTNPPYGERLGEKEEVRVLYRQLADKVTAEFDGWKMAMIVSDGELTKSMGLRAAKKNQFYNGPIECLLLQFNIGQAAVVTAPPPDPDRPWLYHEPSEAAQMFANRLLKNKKKLKNWLQKEDVSCYRIYDRDLPEYAIAVDVYEDEVVCFEYLPPKTVDPDKAQFRLMDAMSTIAPTLDIHPRKVNLKSRKAQKGTEQYEKLKDSKRSLEIKEMGLKFKLNLWDYLDTGIFLDHRWMRREIYNLAEGKRFANLFSYTGTASVYAAAGGAKSTLSLDLSNTYLKWAKENFALNGFDGPQHQFEKADCMEWLRGFKGKFDLIFVDPPSFSNSKSMGEEILDIERDHVEIINLAAKRLSPGGLLIFSTNKRGFKLDYETLERKFHLEIQDVTKQSIPPDFQQNGKIHKAYFIQRKE